MKNILILILCMIATRAGAQVEYMQPLGFDANGQESAFTGWMQEDAHTIYILRSKLHIDTVSTQIAQFYPSFTVTTIDKDSKQAIHSRLFAGDTSSKDSTLSFDLDYSVDGPRIHLLYTKLFIDDTGSSNPYRQYKSAIYYQQLDTALNVLVPEKRLLFSDNNAPVGQAFGTHILQNGNRTLITYSLKDTSTFTVMCKYMLLDMAGNIVQHDTLPMKEAVNTSFPRLYQVRKMPGGQLAFQGYGLINPAIGLPCTWVVTDSNLQLVDTFWRKPLFMQNSTIGGGYYFGQPSMVVLPNGNWMMGGMLECYYSPLNSGEDLPVIVKLTKNTRYTVDSVLVLSVPTPSDPLHLAISNSQALVYNNFDNRLYYADATKYNYGYSCYGPNAAVVYSADTTLGHVWTKYVLQAAPGMCAESYNLKACVGRRGVLLSAGVSPVNFHDTTGTRSYLFYVDSNSNTGIGDPNAPFTIRNRIAAYPNPATDNLTIDDILGRLASATLTNMQGQLIYQKDIGGNKAVIPLKDYPPGLYMLRVKTADGELYSEKISIR